MRVNLTYYLCEEESVKLSNLLMKISIMCIIIVLIFTLRKERVGNKFKELNLRHKSTMVSYHVNIRFGDKAISHCKGIYIECE